MDGRVFWLTTLTAIIGGVVAGWLLGIITPDNAKDFAHSIIAHTSSLLSRPFATWVMILAFFAGVAVVLLFVVLLRDPTRSRFTEVEGVLWHWYLFASRVHVSPVALCPTAGCLNELTLTDQPIWPSPPHAGVQTPIALLSKYPDRYAAHAACGRCNFQKTFDSFASAADLYRSVETELRRRIRTREIKP